MKHQHVLEEVAARGGTAMMPVIASLHACTVSRGSCAGETGIEVRLDGQRIGELTKLQSDRQLQTVRSLVKNGRISGCDGTVCPADKGWEVELRPPRTD